MGALSVPGILVNNIPITIKPNSVKYDEGLPEFKIRVASGGGSRTETVFTEDIETSFSMIAFTLYTTKENVEFQREWKQNKDANTVQWVDIGINRTFNNSAIINKVEVSMGVDGEFEVTFNGSEAVG